ncbi:hypothetical protein TNCV_5128581 [Trichonephila clavipes]|nr:hypothetical protein TNCV_5128581 [Trichonephila clavipes]
MRTKAYCAKLSILDLGSPKVHEQMFQSGGGTSADEGDHSATDQSQQCHSDYSGLFRQNRMQENLRFCSHASLPRSTNQSGHSLPGRPTHIRPHTLSRYGMEERFAFRFPVTPSIIMTKANAYSKRLSWCLLAEMLSFVPPGCAPKGRHVGSFVIDAK